MSALNQDEIWRLVPPEEKLVIMSRSHAHGFAITGSLLLVAGTIAVGLQLKWVFWGGLMISPLIYQFAASKKWRDLKPRVLLEFLAARSVARRYAYSLRAPTLGIELMFRGGFRRVYEDENELDLALSDIEVQVNTATMWVVLLESAFVVVEEGYGGARLAFGHVLDDRIDIEGISPEGAAEYDNERRVFISFQDGSNNPPIRMEVTSEHPVALNALERKFKDAKSYLKTIREVRTSSIDAGEGMDVFEELPM